MLRWIGALWLIVSVAVYVCWPPLEARAYKHGSPIVDGFVGAPAGGNFQRSNFFNSYALQSSQTYTTRPPWRVAGVDYAIGIDSSKCSGTCPSGMKDPCGGTCTVGLQLNMPAGCVLFTGGNYFLCTGTDFTIDGYDFSLHSGLGVRFNATGNLTVSNNYFVVGSNSPANDLVQTAVTANSLTLTGNYFDGSCVSFPTLLSGFVSAFANTFTSTYNVFLNSSQSFTETDRPSTRTEKFNYGEGMVCSNGPHAAWASMQAGGGNMTQFTFSFNTVLEPAIAFGNTGVTAFVEIGGNPTTAYIIDNADTNNNVFVSNKTTGTPGITVSLLAEINGASQAGGSVTVRNSNFLQNYMDPTGALGCYNNVSAPIVPTVININSVNLLDGSAVSGTPSSGITCNGHF